MKLGRLLAPYRCAAGRSFRLADVDPGDTRGLDIGKADAEAMLEDGVARLVELQERLYAENRRAVLVIFQGMDASGKDSAIGHVMRGLNAQGCHVHSFKAPSEQELAHDFLWRAAARLPARGEIGIFNRSYYEEVLVVRVRPELLAAQRLPPKPAGARLWQERFDAINAFERHLARSGTVVLKFFLHISKAEQKQRFLKRIEDPAKNWKFSSGDVEDRKYWDRYMAAYQDMVRHTSTAGAPWYVIPADHKWFTRLTVAAALIRTLEGLDLRYPAADPAALDAARRALMRERS